MFMRISTSETSRAVTLDVDQIAALAALRVCGDVGLLTGAAALGGVAALSGADAAFFCASFGLVASAARFRWAAPGST